MALRFPSFHIPVLWLKTRNRVGEPGSRRRLCLLQMEGEVAAFGTNTCRFLAHIVRKVALSITEPESNTCVIPNEEEILATILRNMVPCLHPIGTYQ